MFEIELIRRIPSGEIVFAFEPFLSVALCFLLKQDITQLISEATIIQKNTIKSNPDVFVRVTQTVGRVLVPSASVVF